MARRKLEIEEMVERKGVAHARQYVEKRVAFKMNKAEEFIKKANDLRQEAEAVKAEFDTVLANIGKPKTTEAVSEATPTEAIESGVEAEAEAQVG